MPASGQRAGKALALALSALRPMATPALSWLRPRAGVTSGTSALGRLGTLEVHLAGDAADRGRAQRLRYDVFNREMGARAGALARLAGRDGDGFDRLCDHLLIVDGEILETPPFRKPRPRLVGTCRLLRGDVAARHRGFYSQGEFDIGPLLARHPDIRFLELGRVCVMPEYRSKRTIELMWHGIWTYVRRHEIDVLFGCASLPGSDPARHAATLGFLNHHAAAAPQWRVSARADRRAAMDTLPAAAIDARAALAALPPLLKGYLRLGAQIGDGAVVDHAFGTTDVFVVLPVAAIDTRYINHFGSDATRHAA
jgi:putative hemolysin